MKTDCLSTVLGQAGRTERSQQFQIRDKVEMEEHVRDGIRAARIKRRFVD